jgi:electron transport complex protein RnfD
MSEETKQILLPNQEELLVSSSPHVHDRQDVRKIMFTVLLALMPACLAGIYFFGIRALLVLIYCAVFCVGVEIIWNWFAGKSLDSWKDCSAILTGVLLGMNLSAGIPWWICLVGGILAIGLGKQVFGGLGYNPFNPALVARVGLLIGFPKYMTTWVPTRFMMETDNPVYSKVLQYAKGVDLPAVQNKVIPFMTSVYDGVTCATPLGVMTTADEVAKLSGKSTADVVAEIANKPAYWDYFIGNVGGCLGETSAIALIAGGIFLILMKLIRWQVPVAYIGTVLVFTGIINAIDPNITPNPLFHVLTGGLLIGAFFMATDMVTSPMTGLGAIIFGVGCGLVTCLIRIWGSYPEGVSFSILFMNAWVPLIDRFTRSKPFGFKPKEKEVAA